MVDTIKSTLQERETISTFGRSKAIDLLNLWNDLDVSVLQKFIKSMPWPLQVVLKNKGGATRY